MYSIRKSNRISDMDEPYMPSAKYGILQLANALNSLFIPKQFSFTKASEKYKVPRQTLGKYYKKLLPEIDKYIGKQRVTYIIDLLEIIRTSHVYSARALNKEQEASLVAEIRCSSNRADPMMSDIIRMRACEIKLGVDTGRMLSLDWYRSFIARHKSILSSRAHQTLTRARAMALNPVDVTQFFVELKRLIDQYQLTADRILNLDENGHDGEGKPQGKVIVEKGQKHADAKQSNYRDHWTVQAIVTVSGQVLPPIFVFTGVQHDALLLKGAPVGSKLGLNVNGYFTTKTFVHVIQHIDNNLPGTRRPLLLIIDGSKTHLSAQALRLAVSKEILVFRLPPNATHRLQPLDVSCFKPLNTAWRQACSMRRYKHPEKTFTRYNVCEVFSPAWMKAMTEKNICAGFVKCGIWPYNPSKITFKEMAPSRTNSNSSIDSLVSTSSSTFQSEQKINIDRIPDLPDIGAIEVNDYDTALLEIDRLNFIISEQSREITKVRIQLNTANSTSIAKKPAKFRESFARLKLPEGTLLTQEEIIEALEHEEKLKEEKVTKSETRKKEKATSIKQNKQKKNKEPPQSIENYNPNNTSNSSNIDSVLLSPSKRYRNCETPSIQPTSIAIHPRYSNIDIPSPRLETLFFPNSIELDPIITPQDITNSLLQ